jgi:CopG family nickel-responsive transcriptional regulator
MPVISLSVNEKMLTDIDTIQGEFGFSGRSEVIRAGIRMLIADIKDREGLTGTVNSVLLLIHDQNVEHIVTEIKHDFEDITSTQIHNHLQGGKCLEIFILDGDADRIKQLLKLFQVSGKMDYVKLFIA